MPNFGTRINSIPSLSAASISDYLLITANVNGEWVSRKITSEVFATSLGLSGVDLTSILADIVTLSGDTNYLAQEILKYIPLSGSTDIYGNLVPASTNTYSLGTSGYQWQDLFVSSGSVYFNNEKLSVISGQIYVNDTLFESGGSTDFTAISGYDATKKQSFAHTSGVNIWNDTIESSDLTGYVLSAEQVLTHTQGDFSWTSVIDADTLYSTKAETTYVSGIVDANTSSINYISGVVDTNTANITSNDSDITYLSAQIDSVSAQLSGSGGGIDLTTVSGYNTTVTQSLTHVSGTNYWEDVAEAADLVGYDATETQVLAQLSGDPQWLDPLDLDSVLNDTVLGEFGPTSGAVVIDLSGTGAYEYTLDGDTSFTAANTEVGKSKYATSLITATTVASVSASFDPTWYWVGARPTDEGTTITSGSFIELVLRSSGTKIIAAYEDLV